MLLISSNQPWQEVLYSVLVQQHLTNIASLSRKDGALERRFQKVQVEPTTIEETLQILENIKDRYEAHHHVSYTEDALKACVKYADRYITDRFFPDKAIDIIDEAGSRIHLQHVKVPQAILDIQKDIEIAQEKKQAAVKNQNF